MRHKVFLFNLGSSLQEHNFTEKQNAISHYNGKTYKITGINVN